MVQKVFKSLLLQIYHSLWILYQTFSRDIRGGIKLLLVKTSLTWAKFKNRTLPDYFASVVARYPTKTAFLCEGSRWTFKEVDETSNQVANYFSSKGFKAGDEVALFMHTDPIGPVIWLGLSKIGVVYALINEDLRHDSLVHSITCVKAKAVIFHPELADAIADIRSELEAKNVNQFYSVGKISEQISQAVHPSDILEESKAFSPKKVLQKHRGNFSDVLCFIYTSGTTGLPKASIIKHSRYMFGVMSRDIMMGQRTEDIVYCCLPLYHSMGAILGAGSAFMSGCTVVFRPKFSASKFWDDCIKFNCTTVIYIGEIVRYLLLQPPKTTDRSHSIRLMYGNGLRISTWSEFRKRFQIPRIVELYGSTEGTTMVNFDGKVGACGFMPVSFLVRPFTFVAPYTLIRLTANYEVARNSKGYAIKCTPGEYGMAVGKIAQNDAIQSFDGYSDPSATRKKVIRDVFRKGDAYFASGDLLFMDELGYLYFKDRLGDTFRWKGQNVSTNEVEGILTKNTGLKDVVCYGVEVPGQEGKAGMITVRSEENGIEIENLYSKVRKLLPKYAIPQFIRVAENISLTGTYKYQKNLLKEEGFNVTNISDKVYYLDQRAAKYKELDVSLYQDILNGQIPF